MTQIDNTSSRIRLLDGHGLSPAQKAVYDTVVSGPRGTMVGPLRAALHSPELADRWSKLGEQLRYNTSLTARYSELAIIIAARHWNSDTEWAIHAEIGRQAGVPEATVNAIRECALPDFETVEEALIYEYGRQLLASGHVDDIVYHALHARFDDVWLVELTALIGYYSMVALTLNAHGIPRPASAGEGLPASGEAMRLPAMPRDRLVLDEAGAGRQDQERTAG